MPRTDRHSRLVGWLKVALPLGALALLSTLFLLADRIDPTAAIRYAEVDVEDLARDPRMTAPSYAGTTSDGTAITMTATAARPANGTRTAGASDVTVRFDMPGGGSTDILAKTAELDSGANMLRLSGGVDIATSSGFHIVTEALDAALDRSGAQSPGDVTASGPQVTITANSFSLQHIASDDPPYPGDNAGGAVGADDRDQDQPRDRIGAQTPGDANAGGDAPAPYLLVFSGAVKLVYEPGSAARETDLP